MSTSVFSGLLGHEASTSWPDIQQEMQLNRQWCEFIHCQLLSLSFSRTVIHFRTNTPLVLVWFVFTPSTQKTILMKCNVYYRSIVCRKTKQNPTVNRNRSWMSFIFTCLLVGLSAGFHKNHWTDFHQTWTEDGTDLISFWCWSRWRDGSRIFFSLSITLWHKTFVCQLQRSRCILKWSTRHI